MADAQFQTPTKRRRRRAPQSMQSGAAVTVDASSLPLLADHFSSASPSSSRCDPGHSQVPAPRVSPPSSELTSSRACSAGAVELMRYFSYAYVNANKHTRRAVDKWLKRKRLLQAMRVLFDHNLTAESNEDGDLVDEQAFDDDTPRDEFVPPQPSTPVPVPDVALVQAMQRATRYDLTTMEGRRQHNIQMNAVALSIVNKHAGPSIGGTLAKKKVRQESKRRRDEAFTAACTSQQAAHRHSRSARCLPALHSSLAAVCCCHCGSGGDEATLVLCDTCNLHGLHIACAITLGFMPDGTTVVTLPTHFIGPCCKSAASAPLLLLPPLPQQPLPPLPPLPPQPPQPQPPAQAALTALSAATEAEQHCALAYVFDVAHRYDFSRANDADQPVHRPLVSPLLHLSPLSVASWIIDFGPMPASYRKMVPVRAPVQFIEKAAGRGEACISITKTHNNCFKASIEYRGAVAVAHATTACRARGSAALQVVRSVGAMEPGPEVKVLAEFRGKVQAVYSSIRSDRSDRRHLPAGSTQPTDADKVVYTHVVDFTQRTVLEQPEGTILEPYTPELDYKFKNPSLTDRCMLDGAWQFSLDQTDAGLQCVTCKNVRHFGLASFAACKCGFGHHLSRTATGDLLAHIPFLPPSLPCSLARFFCRAASPPCCLAPADRQTLPARSSHILQPVRHPNAGEGAPIRPTFLQAQEAILKGESVEDELQIFAEDEVHRAAQEMVEEDSTTNRRPSHEDEDEDGGRGSDDDDDDDDDDDIGNLTALDFGTLGPNFISGGGFRRQGASTKSTTSGASLSAYLHCSCPSSNQACPSPVSISHFRPPLLWLVPLCCAERLCRPQTEPRVLSRLYDSRGRPARTAVVIEHSTPSTYTQRLDKLNIIRSALARYPASIASSTKRIDQFTVTKQYNGGDRVSKACQNAVHVKELVLHGRRIDSFDFESLVAQHGIAVLSDVTVLPATHSMPAAVLLQDLAFKEYLHREVLEAWQRLQQCAATSSHLQHVIDVMQKAAPKSVRLNLTGLSQTVRDHYLDGLHVQPNHESRTTGWYEFCPRIHPDVPLLTWTLNMSDLLSSSTGAFVASVASTSTSAPASTSTASTSTSTSTAASPASPAAPASTPASTPAAASTANDDAPPLPRRKVQVLYRHIDEFDLLRGMALNIPTSINMRLDSGRFVMDVFDDVYEALATTLASSTSAVLNKAPREPGEPDRCGLLSVRSVDVDIWATLSDVPHHVSDAVPIAGTECAVRWSLPCQIPQDTCAFYQRGQESPSKHLEGIDHIREMNRKGTFPLSTYAIECVLSEELFNNSQWPSFTSETCSSSHPILPTTCLPACLLAMRSLVYSCPLMYCYFSCSHSISGAEAVV